MKMMKSISSNLIARDFQLLSNAQMGWLVGGEDTSSSSGTASNASTSGSTNTNDGTITIDPSIWIRK